MCMELGVSAKRAATSSQSRNILHISRTSIYVATTGGFCFGKGKQRSCTTISGPTMIFLLPQVLQVPWWPLLRGSDSLQGATQREQLNVPNALCPTNRTQSRCSRHT